MTLARRPRPWFSQRYVALDFETSGLSPGTDAVVSYGTVPIEQGRARLDRSRYRLVHSEGFPTDSVKIHRIRPVDLTEAPPLAAVLPELAVTLARDPVVAWAAWVEAGFLAALFGGRVSAWRRRIVDVRDLVSLLDGRDGRRGSRSDESLHSAAARLGVPLEESHHALADAFVTAQLFLVVVGGLGRATPVSVASVLRGGGGGATRWPAAVRVRQR